MKRPFLMIAGPLLAAAVSTVVFPAEAAGPSSLKARSGARTNISTAPAASRPVARPAATGEATTRPATRPAPGQGGGVHIQQDNDINVNVQGNQHGGYHGATPYHDDGHDDHHDHDHDHDDWDDWDEWDDHPFATAAAITTGVAVTNAIIGSIVYSVPPQCVPVAVNGITYQQCGNTWYQPQYSGTTIQYIVVAPPM